MKRNPFLALSAHLYFKLCLAGIVENLKEKYPLLANKIEYLAHRDPSGRHKYLNYATKVLVSGQALETEIADVVDLFHKFRDRLEKKDIYAYPNFTELRDLLFDIRNELGGKSKRQQKNEIKTSGGEKIYEDDQCVVMRVDTKAAACFYGSGTKWCITMSGQRYFEQYSGENFLFYFVLRKDLDKENAKYKIAIAARRKSYLRHPAISGEPPKEVVEINFQFFDSLDNQIGKLAALSGLNIQNIMDIIEDDIPKQPNHFLYLLNKSPSELSIDDYRKNIGNFKKEISESRYTPDEILLEILDTLLDIERSDDDFSIIRAITSNHHLSNKVINKILNIDNRDGNYWLGLLQFDTQKLFDTIINNFMHNKNIKEVFRGLASNKQLTDDIALWLFEKNKQDKELVIDDIIWNLVSNRAISRSIIQKIQLQHSDVKIRNHARRELETYHSSHSSNW